MFDQPLSGQTAYSEATDMDAIAMTAFPKIDHVVDQLRMVRVPVPRPKPNEVAIKLAASSMHVDEIYAAQGTCLGRFCGPKKVSEQNPHILGSSVTGTIVAVGRSANTLSVGDEVIVIPNHTGEIGSWATYRCVAEDMVMLKPAELTHVEAAALTMASCVAYGAIDMAQIRPGQRCLVIGASGAIGAIMVQLLKSKGAHITGVCSGPNTELVLSNGAEAVIDYTKDDFGNVTVPIYDVVFDTIGGRDTERRALRALKRSGRFVTIVGPERHIGQTKLSWPAFLGVAGYVVWRVCTSWINRPRYIFGERLPRKTIRPVMDLIIRHSIRMPIDREIPFEINAIKDAVSHLTSHRAKGRIVINFSTDMTAAISLPEGA